MRLLRVARTPDFTPVLRHFRDRLDRAYTPAQVKGALTATALDSMEVGVDRDSGYRIPMALSAVQYALSH